MRNEGASERELILEDAMLCVCQDRNAQYGSPEDSFQLIADFWTTYLGVAVTATNVAMMMALLKIARTKTSKDGVGSRDCYIDLAGYAACGGEIAERRN